MPTLHPKVTLPAVAGLGWTAICLALQQYDPNIAPNAPLTAAFSTFLMALVGYFSPGGSSE